MAHEDVRSGGALKHFPGQDLDVHRKIANLGEKTFRWESGTEVHEAKFNYTLNSPAAQLLQILRGWLVSRNTWT